MKRTRIAVLSCTAVLCFALLVGAIWAAVVATFGINTKLTFNPNGVYVELSGQIYRGTSYSELEPLLDDPTYTLETCKNYTTDETGTPTAYSTPQWAANEVLFLPTEKVIQFKLNVTNKGDKQISVVPTNDVTITGVTVSEEASDTLAIPAGETREYRITLTAGTTELKSVPFELNLDIVNTEDIENPASDFTMDATTPTQLNSINTGYSNPVYTDNRILVVPETISANKVLTVKPSTPLFDGLATKTKYVILPRFLEDLGSAFVYASNVTSVYIPDGVKELVETFKFCSSLTSVTIPANLTLIGEFAFVNCSSLASISIPGSVKSIKNQAFMSCTALQKVVISDGVESLDFAPFAGCNSLTSVSIPSSISDLGRSAFDSTPFINNLGDENGLKIVSSSDDPNCKFLLGCTSNVKPIITAEMMRGVRLIAGSAFSSCASLNSIVVPNEVVGIGQSAFSGCTSLETISIPFVGGSASKNNFFGYIFGASSYSENETNVPSSLKNVIVTGESIGDHAFYGCSSLASITISNSVTNLGMYAFYNCTSLTSMTIPGSIGTVNYRSFYGCASLVSVTLFEGITTIAPEAFAVCTSLTSIVMPNTLTDIVYSAFSGCTSLSSITIPGSVKSIGYSAFYGCTSLKYIKMSGNTLSSAYTLPTASGKVWVTSGSASMPSSWTGNVVTTIPTSAGDLYYHQQAAWEK